MMRSVLSEAGYLRAVAIIDAERRWAGTEEGMGSEFYRVALYGDPQAGGRWGWRLGGHHLSLHFTFENDALISWSPLFFGTHPWRLDVAGVLEGRVLLGDRRDLAVDLWRLLDRTQRTASLLPSRTIPMGGSFFASVQGREVAFPEPRGVRVRELTPAARAIVQALVADFTSDVRAHLGPAGLGPVGLGEARIAFEGDPSGGAAFYYRVQGASWLIEVEDEGNHLHSLWRSDADFGGAAR